MQALAGILGLSITLWATGAVANQNHHEEWETPHHETISYQGTCWIDDDSDFDKGQTNAGIVYGASSYSLRKECGFAAEQAFGAQSSSAVFDIQSVDGYGKSVEAECWIDDDPDFDFGQKSAGSVIAHSSYFLRKECALVAEQRYGGKGSSGIKNVRLVPTPGGLLQAECWVDDDLDFDFGQKNAGLVIASSTYQLRRECGWVAETWYGDQGSSGLKNVQPAKGGSSVEADCWIDDDPDFDFGQKQGGKVFGRSTFLLRRECQLIAEERYGEKGSSGLKNVRVIP